MQCLEKHSDVQHKVVEQGVRASLIFQSQGGSSDLHNLPAQLSCSSLNYSGRYHTSTPVALCYANNTLAAEETRIRRRPRLPIVLHLQPLELSEPPCLDLPLNDNCHQDHSGCLLYSAYEAFAYSLLTSRPNILLLTQSKITNNRFRVLKHMPGDLISAKNHLRKILFNSLKYAERQKR